jgi:hypothetical protein
MNLTPLAIRLLRPEYHPSNINKTLGVMHEEDDPVTATALAIIALPLLALQRPHVAAKGVGEI